jgi:hypothetical protein
MSWLDSSYLIDSHKKAEFICEASLSQEQLAVALTQNTYWWQSLADRWMGETLCGWEHDTAEFAECVREWQLANTDLEPDGVFDERMNQLFGGQPFVPPTGTDYILVNGEHVACDFSVVSPDEPGALVFDHGFYDTGLLTPDLFVVHWDGCMDSHQCFNVLRSRKLAVPFMLDSDSDATIYQGVDPAKATCWHAGSVNRRAWGVEIANPVLPERNAKCKPPREITQMFVRGDTHKVLDFYPQQLKKLVKLLDWSCTYAGIPRQLPAYKGKVGDVPSELWKSVANSYIKGPGDKWNVDGFKGIIGHYHQDNNKCDAGMYPLWQYVLENLPGCRVVEVG